MEVSEHGADHAKLVSRIDKDASLGGLRDDSAVRRMAGRGFQRAHGGGADRDDSASGIAGPLNPVRSLDRDRIPLAMDLVLLDHFYADGLKGSESNVQRNFGSLDATRADAVKHFGGEVQSGSGSSDRGERSRIYRLVLLAIQRRVGAIDVRRQWHVSYVLDH